MYPAPLLNFHLSQHVTYTLLHKTDNGYLTRLKVIFLEKKGVKIVSFLTDATVTLKLVP